MTVKEAYKTVEKKFADMYIYGCTEYKNLYVFNMCMKKEKENLPKVRGMLWSVNKRTGESKVFLPFHLSPEEYKNGKEIKDFK